MSAPSNFFKQLHIFFWNIFWSNILHQGLAQCCLEQRWPQDSAEPCCTTDKKLKSFINIDNITCSALKPWINTGKYWNLNSADFAQHCIFAVPKAALCKALVYLEYPQIFMFTKVKSSINDLWKSLCLVKKKKSDLYYMIWICIG